MGAVARCTIAAPTARSSIGDYTSLNALSYDVILVTAVSLVESLHFSYQHWFMKRELDMVLFILKFIFSETRLLQEE